MCMTLTLTFRMSQDNSLLSNHVWTSQWTRFECLTLKMKVRDVDDLDENCEATLPTCICGVGRSYLANVHGRRWEKLPCQHAWAALREATLPTCMGGVDGIDGDVCHQHIGGTGYRTWRWRLLSGEIKSENRIGPKTELWGTPIATAVVPDLSPQILTKLVRQLRLNRTHSSVSPPRPSVFQSADEGGMVDRTAVRSMVTRTVAFLAPTASNMSFEILRKAVSVRWWRW